MNKLLLLICTLLFGVLVGRAQTVNVTFQVDMSVQIAKGAFSPGNNQVSVRGSFNDWGETAMTDDNADSVYVVTVAIAQNSAQVYKYYHSGGGGTWEGGADKQLAVGTSDVTVPVSFFNGEGMPSGNLANVTFEVDMRLPARQGAFSPSTKHVYVAGSFTDWQNSAIELTDANSDSIYTVTTPLNSAQLLTFKFIWANGPATAGTEWESVPDRKYWVVDGDQTVSKFWNDTDPNVTLADGNIFFEVNMSVLTELGIFNPSTDSVQIRGSFNGWNDSQPAKSRLTQDAIDPNAWFLNIPFVQQEVNGIQAYKFFIKKPSAAVQYSNTGWEVPIGNTITGDRNRPIAFQGTETQEAPIAYFENIHPNWVIPSGTSVEVTYRVDMRPATKASVQGSSPVFNPAADTVYWIPRQPIYYALNQLEWNLEQRVLRLTDVDGDTVFTGTLTINGPAFNGFLYNYAYTSASGFIQEDGGQGGARVRFIAQPAPRTFFSPFTMPEDVWTNGDKPEEQAPLLTNVEIVNYGLPRSHSLSQNYPNPFNPSTKIEFSLATKERVTLKVFNLLGQEVATLVNEELAPGNYRVPFDGRGLSSGIYFYRITAGEYVQLKRMALLK